MSQFLIIAAELRRCFDSCADTPTTRQALIDAGYAVDALLATGAMNAVWPFIAEKLRRNRRDGRMGAVLQIQRLAVELARRPDATLGVRFPAAADCEVLTHCDGAARAALGALTELVERLAADRLDVLADGAATQAGIDADQPDAHGYVERPADPSAYVPVSRIIAEHAPANWRLTLAELGRLLNDYPNTRLRWTRPAAQRRSVHLADWFAYAERRTPGAGDGWRALAAGELASRTAAVRRGRA